MNNGYPNQGMRCIREIVRDFGETLAVEEFDVRAKNEIPDTSFDIYISSGGPGDPTEGNGVWEVKFNQLIEELWQVNKGPLIRKKYFFFICHSFQLACLYFELGKITQRKSTSFGVYPIHKTAAGRKEAILDGLEDPYYAVDSRDWQLVQPKLKVFKEHGATILSLEKIRTHVEYERAIMAVRFSHEFIGTQFHPEADPEGMKAHFSEDINKQKVIRNFGEKKYEDMMEHLDDPDKINLTHAIILPKFIRSSIDKLRQQLIIEGTYDIEYQETLQR